MSSNCGTENKGGGAGIELLYVDMGRMLIMKEKSINRREMKVSGADRDPPALLRVL